jgi:Dolichyl-phosphate-mannose-protein mannosyltransferase
VSGPRRRLAPEAWLAALAAALFIAVSIWWLLYDQRAPGGSDPSRHIATAGAIGDLLADGDLDAPITFEGSWDFFYPPLVRTIGAVPSLFGLDVHDWGTIALNLVFVPLLVAGCYLTARKVYGRRAGLLAAIFALGTPMVLQLFHVFLIDAALAAVTAITVWALLETERFADRRWSVIAGLLIGVGLLTKTPAPLFVLGVIAVMLAGGGWRRWQNVALCAAGALVVAAPFYIVRLDDFTALSESAVATGGPGADAFAYAPNFEGLSRFGIDSFGYYLWTAVNVQYLVPLLALFAVGLVYSLRELRSRRYVPELLAGLAIGYLAMTFLTLHDPRYTLPLVVYVAVIGTGWIVTRAPDWARGAAVGLLAAAVAVNLAAVTIGDLGTLKLSLGDTNEADPIEPRALTFADERGYVTGEPRPDPFWTDLLEAAEREGVETVEVWAGESPTWGTDEFGFEVLAKQHGISGPWNFTATYPDPDAKPEMLVKMWVTEEGLRKIPDVKLPCATIEEGWQPPGTDGAALKVSVERLGPDGNYRRWCRF